MKKNAPKILAIFLLSVIAVLMVIAGTEGFGGLLGKKEHNIESGSANNEFSDITPQQPIPDEPKPDVTETVLFPVPPEASAIYSYTQSLWSPSGMALNGVVQTSEGIYIAVTHESTDGILKTDGRRISLVRADNDGTLLSAIHLPSRNNDIKFLCAKLTSSGIVLVAEDGERSYVYTVSTDLKKSELLELPRFNAATVFALSEGYLVIGAGAMNTVYKIIGNAVVVSTSLGAGEVADIYDFGSYYALVISGISGYSISKIGNTLTHISTITISERQLLAIRPVVINGVQKFLVAEKSNTGVELVRYNSDFRVLEAERVGVGLAESAEVFMNDQSVFALLHATTDRLYVIDSNLDFKASSSGVFAGMTELYDYALYENGFCALYANGDMLTITDVRNDATSETRNIAVTTDKAYVAVTSASKKIIVFAVENGVKILGL